MDLTELEATKLSIWRDLHYYIPQDSALVCEEDGSCQLATLSGDSYLLLGDNVPRSKDARYGAQFGVVSRAEILGVVVEVH